MKNQTKSQRWTWKIWVFIASLVLFVAAGGLSSSAKADIVNGSQIGTINNKPVVKAQSNDMSSKSFQATVDGLLKSANTDGVRYVADNIGWQSNTQLYNGKALGSFGDAARFFLGNDGFLSTDSAIHVNKGAAFYVQNVGTIKDITTGQRIPVSMEVTNNGLAHGSDGQTNEDAIYAVKNVGGTITIGAVTPASGSDSGGGQSENGGGSGGNVGDGSLVGFIEKVRTSVSLVRSDTGQKIPDNDILIAMKVSDVDANQLAEVGANGAIGYIVAPNTALSVSGNGLRSTSDGASNSDSSLLMDNSYVVLKRFNSSLVDYSYLDGKGDHVDIVWALFGEIHFELNLEGTFTLDKSLLDFGDNLPNNLYAFKPIVFDIFDSAGKDVGDIIIPADGKPVESPKLRAGDYTVKERDSSVTSATGQTVNTKSYKVTVIAGKTGTAGPTVKVDNKAVLGEITVTKTGVESDDKMWNENYSLAGNEFKLTSQTDGKVYTAKTDKDGKFTVKNLPLGKYLIEETKASDGFVNTFKPVEVTLTWKDNKTEVVYGTAKGTNQEIKGQNQLNKTDKETDTTDSRGQGDMGQAKYQLFYGDESVGSAPHKKGQPVKEHDIPNAAYTILKGTKVPSYYADGKLVAVGDNLVLQVDAKELSVSVGNLPLGKYLWKEVDSGTGYATDSKEYPFEIVKKDDQTANIVTDNVKSQEQLIKAKINFRKSVEIPGESVSSGYNDIDFIFTPLDGTKADPKVVTTGIKDDMDGYGEVVLEWGKWKMSEDPETIPAGFLPIKDIYIIMTYDRKTDVVTIIASHNEDGSNQVSKRQFYLSDYSGVNNDTIKGSVGGTITDDVPFISLSRLNLTDKGEIAPEPSIDVEKSSEAITQPGIGNNADKPDNLGKGDADTAQTAVEVTEDKTTINFQITNNGTEDLTKVKAVDKTIEGKTDVKDIKWTYNGEALTTNKDGFFLLSDKLLVLKVGETLKASGTLELAPGETHADVITVTGVGVTSGKEVSDKDEWHGKREKPPVPSIDVEKSSEAITESGAGNNTDKPNNLGKGDADTVETAVTLGDKATTINFRITNNGAEALSQIQATDKTIDGKKDVKSLKWTYKDKVLTLNKSGEFELDGKLLVLQVGEFISGTGTLDPLAPGETHADEITVSAVGVTSGTKVGDKDKWHAKRDAALPKTDEPKGTLPMTGEQKAKFAGFVGLLIIAGVVFIKRRAIQKLL